MKFWNLIFFSFLVISSWAQVLSSSFVAKAKYSNKQVVWYEYAYWIDGTLLNDKKNSDKFNDILFKKVGNKYYKAQVEGAFNVKDWGVKDDLEKGNAKENSARIQEMLNYFPIGSTASIYIPSGDYRFSSHITLEGRPLHLFGDNGTVWGKGTHLYFPKEQAGMLISKCNGAIIENLALFGGGNEIEWRDGILIRGIATLKGVYVKGFYNGIEASCNITSEGTNCSGMSIEKCFAAENTNNGFHFQGEDANAITVIASDSRDNGGFGFYDGSFLGNNFITCMGHYNKGGDFFVRDKANARSMFLACYSEGGNKVSQLNPLSTVIGGLWGTGYSKDGKTVLQ